MQFQSDILDVNIDRPEIIETTALGAAYLAGLAVDFYKKKNEITSKWKVQKEFVPSMDKNKRTKLYKGWKRAVSRAIQWELEDTEDQD